MKLVKLTAAAGALVVGLAAAASAMPVQKLATEMTGAKVDQVRLVCNRWGHCWHVGWGRGYYSYGYYPGWHRWHHWHRHWW